MMKGGHEQTNQLHDNNWGALDHPSRAPLFMLCNYSVCVCVCACVHVKCKVSGWDSLFWQHET